MKCDPKRLADEVEETVAKIRRTFPNNTDFRVLLHPETLPEMEELAGYKIERAIPGVGPAVGNVHVVDDSSFFRACKVEESGGAYPVPYEAEESEDEMVAMNLAAVGASVYL